MKFRWFPFFVLLILLFTGIRLAHLEADSTPDISISAAPFTDEALKAYSSRNHYLFHEMKWTPRDGYRSWYEKSVLSVGIYNRWFELFGPSYSSLRILNILFSIMTLVLLFFLVKHFYDILQAFVAIIIYGFNTFLIMFNRLGFFENMLNFFILLIFFSFCSLYEHRGRMKQAITDPSINSAKEMIYILIAVTTGCLATVAGLFTKQSISLVIIAIVPFLTLYLFYSHRKLNNFLRLKFYVTITGIVLGYIMLGHFGYFDKFFKQILSVEVFDISLGYFLPLKRTSANFDAIYLSFIKSLFLEFVFIQPIIFFTGMFYALYSYYRFLYKNDLNLLDTAFSTWFLFGFLFLAIMRYHPARYYMLLTMPLVILSTRFFTSGKDLYFNDLVEGAPRFLSFRRIIVKIFLFYLYLYSGVFIVMNFTPFAVRKAVYDFFFFNITGDRWNLVYPVIGFVVLFLIFNAVAVKVLVRNIEKKFSPLKLKKALFALMIIIQLFGYSKWYFFDEYNVVSYSRALGKHLRSDTILVGCWAAALGQENNLRTLVMQEKMRYNVKLTEALIAGEKIEMVPYRDESLRHKHEGAPPVYLTVAKNAPFDMKIAKHFNKYLVPERLLTEISLGLYDVSVYRLDGKVSEKRRRAINDEFKN